MLRQVRQYGKGSGMVTSKYIAGGKATTSRRGSYIPRTVALRTTRAERKTVDLFGVTGGGLVTTIVSTTPSISLINGIALGTEVFNRIGRKTRMHSLQIIGRFAPYTNVPVTDKVRIVIVYDRQGSTAGTAPVWGEVFSSQDAAGTVSATNWAFNNSSNFERFLILADDRFTLPNAPTAAVNVANNLMDYNQKTMYKKFIKLKNLTTHFGQVGVSAALPTTGAIYLMVMGEVPLATAPYSFDWCGRLRFDDY